MKIIYILGSTLFNLINVFKKLLKFFNQSNNINNFNNKIKNKNNNLNNDYDKNLKNKNDLINDYSLFNKDKDCLFDFNDNNFNKDMDRLFDSEGNNPLLKNPNNPNNQQNLDEDIINNKLNVSYFKKLYFKIRNKLFISDEEDEELIFKELKIKSDSMNQNYIRNENIFNNKYSLNKLLNKDIRDFINVRLVIPLIILILTTIIFLIYILFGMEIALAIMIMGIMGLFVLFYMPKMQREKKYSEISKELPYALRHMVTELRSGKGLHDTLNSIAAYDYGALSEEFSRVLEEIKYGESTENALLHMSMRVSSNGLDRTIQQIIGTLRTGGNLSNTLNIIAEDITHDLQMQLKDYSQKLNAFIMIYTFLAILAPVIFLIMLMAASTVMGDIIPSNLVLILYIFFFPMIVIFMGLLIKKMEPNV